jgi:hypothetical protein
MVGVPMPGTLILRRPTVTLTGVMVTLMRVPVSWGVKQQKVCGSLTVVMSLVGVSGAGADLVVTFLGAVFFAFWRTTLASLPLSVPPRST